MKAISLWQPWASLMAMGLKKIETRHWSTSHRGPLLIHAAKRKPKKHERIEIKIYLTPFGIEPIEYDSLPYGSIVCQVNLKDCQQIAHENCPSKHELEYWLGNYDHGRWMWITDNLKRFRDPIPWKGCQRFFNVPDSVISLHLGQ